MAELLTGLCMYKKLFSLILFPAILLCSACADKLSGKDEAAFKASKAKVEQGLNEKEKVDLEKALRVIVLKVMKEKFSNPDASKGQSFDEMSMKLVDGKSFSGVVDLAEDFLKKDSEEKQREIKTEIDSLRKQKAEFGKITAVLDQFKLTAMDITLDESWDEMVPFLNLTFTNNTNKDIIGAHMFQTDIFAKSTGKLLFSQGWGGTFNDGFAITPHETYETNDVLPTDAKEHRAKFWATAKYPLKDFSGADLVVKVYLTKLTTTDGTIERPKEYAVLDQKITDLEAQLKALQALKGTLDELELTK